MLTARITASASCSVSKPSWPRDTTPLAALPPISTPTASRWLSTSPPADLIRATSCVQRRQCEQASLEEPLTWRPRIWGSHTQCMQHALTQDAEPDLRPSSRWCLCHEEVPHGFPQKRWHMRLQNCLVVREADEVLAFVADALLTARGCAGAERTGAKILSLTLPLHHAMSKLFWCASV